MRFLAAFALVAAMCLMGAATAAVDPTPAPAASVAARIDNDVRGLAGTEIGAVDLQRDGALRKTLAAAGMIRRSGNAWVFTPAALRQSTDCGMDDAAGRCFPLVTVRRLRSVRVVHTDATFEDAASDATVFTYTATPSTALAKRLADAGVLVCSIAPRRMVPWRGAATIAQGAFVVSEMTSQPDRGNLSDLFCPHTRLSDGQQVYYAIDDL